MFLFCTCMVYISDIITSLEKNKNKNSPHLSFAESAIDISTQAKDNYSEEGEQAGDIWRVLEKITDIDFELFQQMQKWGVAWWELEGVPHAHQWECPHERIGAEHSGGRRKEEKAMHLWILDGEAHCPQEDARLWGQQDHAWSPGIELLKHNGGNKLQLCPTKVNVCNLNWALTEAHFGTNGLRGFILNSPINDSLHMRTLWKRNRKALTWLFLNNNLTSKLYLTHVSLCYPSLNFVIPRIYLKN